MLVSRVCVAAFVLAAAFSDTSYAAALADEYEASPYSDNTSVTTANILTIGASPQEHSIHEAADEDWGICPISDEASAIYSLRFTNLVIPTGSALLVDIYEDGADQPPVSDFISDNPPAIVDMNFTATGINQIYYSIYYFGDVDPSTSYSLTLMKQSGANNGVAIAIGSRAMDVKFDTATPPSGSAVGFDVMRSLYTASPTYSAANSTIVPLPPAYGTCPGTGCVQFGDSGLKPGTIYLYQILEKRSDNSTSQHTGVFYGYTQPSEDDSDGDGLKDTIEDKNKNGAVDSGETNLYNRDSDGDLFEDGVEVVYQSDPLNASSSPPSGFPYNTTTDADGDGYKDFYEYAHGFDPSSSGSKPSLGDVDNGGSLGGADAIILKRVVVGTLNQYNYNFNKMNVNRDALITGADAVILQRRIVGTIPLLPN